MTKALDLSGVNNYVWPPRAVTALPPYSWQLPAGLGWIAQPKFNDSHAVFDLTVSCGEIFLNKVWDRHKGELKHDFTPLKQNIINYTRDYVQNNKIIDGRILFDGGLLHNKHAAIKQTIVIHIGDTIGEIKLHKSNARITESRSYSSGIVASKN